MNDATNGSAGCDDELARRSRAGAARRRRARRRSRRARPHLRSRGSRSASAGRALASSSCSSPRTAAFVCASSAASGSSRSEHARIARERPRQGDPLPLAARQLARLRVREVRDAEPLEAARRRVPSRRSATFPRTLRCGKSAYSWKTSPTRRSSGRRIDSARGRARRRRRARSVPFGAARAPRSRGAPTLPRARGPDERDGAARPRGRASARTSEAEARSPPRGLPREHQLEEHEEHGADDDEQGAHRERGVEVDRRTRS